MADYKDYYKILGVGKSAGEADIKKAFKAAARKYHPDMHPEAQKPAMTEKFKDINEAYEVLSDKQKRAVYDQVGSGGYQNYARGGGHGAAGQAQHGAGQSYGGGNPFAGGGFNFHSTGGFEQGDFSDFFQSIFGGMGGMGKRGGQGGNPFAGFGAQREESLDNEANLSLDLTEAYKGGLVSLTLPNGRQTRVKLPARISDGAKMKLKGMGNKTRSGAGDLYINIKITPHHLYRLEGDDIYAPVDIAPWTAALGGAAAVNMPDGETLNIKIPPGSRSGAKLKLSGKGLGKNGAMYVQLMINNPKNLTKTQKEYFAKLAGEGA